MHRPYPGTEEMAKRGNVEVKFSGPDGVTIDLSEHGGRHQVKDWQVSKPAPTKLTAESRVVRKNPFMLRGPQHERGGIIGNSSP